MFQFVVIMSNIRLFTFHLEKFIFSPTSNQHSNLTSGTFECLNNEKELNVAFLLFVFRVFQLTPISCYMLLNPAPKQELRKFSKPLPSPVDGCYLEHG